MKHTRLLLIVVAYAAIIGVAPTPVCQAGDDVVSARHKIEAFDLSDVALLPSPFLDAQQKNSNYLLSVEPDRLLARIRKNSGLEPKAEGYGGWEAQSISGHSLGHYLSAVAKSYASTGDKRFKDRADYIVSELKACQEKYGTGMLPLDEHYEKVFGEIARGDVRTQGFDLNGLWVPWYAMHKVFAGVLDAYRYCDSPNALDVAKRFGDWAIEATKNLSFEQFQKMLLCEYGGTNDAFYSLYAATGDEKYLRQGDRFYDEVILKPLREERDQLRGRHANTQIPKIIGLARRYEVAPKDDIDAYKTANFFWTRVSRHHSYAIGGNSSGEHFGEPDVISTRLSNSTCETCNTYNMLKLTQKLYQQSGDVEYMNFFERALCNHILASVDRDLARPNSLYTYFVPLIQGGFRHYSTAERDWTCCHGTGMENHAQYNGEIYYREKGSDGIDVLYVNLYIPSRLQWREKDVVVEISPDGKFSVDAKSDVKFVVKARVPNNCDVQGDAKALDGYITLGENWSQGKTEKELPFAPRWTVEPTPDNPNMIAIFFGPFLYAAEIGAVDKPVASLLEVSPTSVASNEVKAATIPVVIQQGDDKLELEPKSAAFASLFDLPTAVPLDAAEPQPTSLAPFFQAKERYVAYFNLFTETTWKEKQEAYQRALKRRLEIEKNTIDHFQPGEMQPERDANFAGEKTFAGEFNGRKWRDARDGGWFEFDLKVDPEKETLLLLDYWGDETGNRNFDILVDGQKIAERRLANDRPGTFFEESYPIPNPEKRAKVRVRLQGKPGATAGGIFGARSILRSFEKEYFGESERQPRRN